MEQVSLKLTIFFEEGFYCGLFESRQGTDLSVCRVVFGAEPKAHEIFDLITQKFADLDFSPILKEEEVYKRVSPKRLQRLARKEMEKPSLSTKSQEALKLQQETKKQERQSETRAAKQSKRERLFALKQEKRRAKHKGH